MTESSKKSAHSDKKEKEKPKEEKVVEKVETGDKQVDEFFSMVRLHRSSIDGDPTPLYILAFSALLGFVILSAAVWFAADGLVNSIDSATGKTIDDDLAKTATGQLDFDVDGTSYSRPYIGAKDAKVTVIEFSEFPCPFCSRVQPTIEQLLHDYGDDLNLVHMNFIVHPDQAVPASTAVECAGDQDKYFLMHKNIFESKALQKDDLRQVAEEIGLDMDEYDACISKGKQDELSMQQALGSKKGIRGTPSFLIGKIDDDGQFDGQLLVGAQPIEQFKAAIDSQIEK